MPARKDNESKGCGMRVLMLRDIRENHQFRPVPLTGLDNEQSMPSTFIGGKYKARGSFGALRESYSHETRFGIAMVFLGLAALIMLATGQTAFALNPLVVYTESSTSTDDILNYSTFSSSWSSGATAVDTNDSVALTWHLRAPARPAEKVSCLPWARRPRLFTRAFTTAVRGAGEGGPRQKFGYVAILAIGPRISALQRRL